MQSIFFCGALPVRKRPVWRETKRCTNIRAHPRPAVASEYSSSTALSISIGSIRLDSPERDAHVPRTLLLAKLDSRPIIRKSGVFERSVSSSPILSFYLSDSFTFVLFTLFCDFAHWRCTVYFQYGRLFTVSTCWISIYIYIGILSSWFMRTRGDRAMNCITDRRSYVSSQSNRFLWHTVPMRIFYFKQLILSQM